MNKFAGSTRRRQGRALGRILALASIVAAGSFPNYMGCDRGIAPGDVIMGQELTQSQEAVRLVGVSGETLPCGSSVGAGIPFALDFSLGEEHQVLAMATCHIALPRQTAPIHEEETAKEMVLPSGAHFARPIDGACQHRTSKRDSMVTFHDVGATCTLSFASARGYSGTQAGLPCAYNVIAPSSDTPLKAPIPGAGVPSPPPPRRDDDVNDCDVAAGLLSPTPTTIQAPTHNAGAPSPPPPLPPQHDGGHVAARLHSPTPTPTPPTTSSSSSNEL